MLSRFAFVIVDILYVTLLFLCTHHGYTLFPVGAATVQCINSFHKSL